MSYKKTKTTKNIKDLIDASTVTFSLAPPFQFNSKAINKETIAKKNKVRVETVDVETKLPRTLMLISTLKSIGLKLKPAKSKSAILKSRAQKISSKLEHIG